MYRRDYLVRQFEEFGKVLAMILGLKKDENFPELLDQIEEASEKFTSTEINYAEILDDDKLLDTLLVTKKLNDEQLKMLADLLYEKAEYHLKAQRTQTFEADATNCYKKAYIIYLFLKERATLPYSLDMHYKVEILSKMGLLQ